MNASLQTLDIALGGMTCDSCVMRVERALKQVAGAAMAASSVTVMANALLLRRWRPGRA